MTPERALVNFAAPDGSVHAGIVVDGRVIDFPNCGSAPIGTLADAYAHWADVQSSVAAAQPAFGKTVETFDLLSPSLDPSGIYCAGVNYQDHVDAVYRKQNIALEPSVRELGLPPWHFLKARNTLRGHLSTIPLFTECIDWEIELAAVIGHTARNVAVEDALSYVAGYTVAIDLSARDRVLRAAMNPTSPFRYDWIAQKSFEGACPLGPWLVPAGAINPNELDLQLTVNGRVRQNSNTRHMIYSTAEQIAHLSTIITLSPGDIILTGTPAGTGFESNEFLKSGDVVTAAIEHIGELSIKMTS